jgi:hypothetical protein
LISVLVIMTLIFLAAGVIAVGTSTLVISERQPDSVVSNDLTVQSAVAAAIGSRKGCSIPKFSTKPVGVGGTSLTVTGATVTSYCTGLMTTPTKSAWPLAASKVPGSNCWTAPLPKQVAPLAVGHYWLLFNATWPSGVFMGQVFLAGSGTGCPTAPSPTCTDAPWTLFSSDSFRQVAVLCDLEFSASKLQSLVFQGVQPSSILFGLDEDTTGPPAYFILREQFPQSLHSHDEEAVVSVSSGVPSLLYEAQLP